MSALRALRQVSLSSSRTLAARSACRALPALAPRAAPLVATRGFAASARRAGEGESDVTLAQKLAEELKYEREAAKGEPEFIKTFKEQGVWALKDTPEHDEIALERKFGNENIRVMFSTSDIQQQEPELEEEEDVAEDEDEDVPTSYNVRCAITVTKDNSPGVLSIDSVTADGQFVIDGISYYHDTKVGTELTADADYKRRGLYIGPQFDTLDVAVQEEFEKFLSERGVNETLAFFIPEYAEYKEQKEYVNWLGNVKKFIEA
ncbi:mitochondrial glyco protein [Obba rivulosa]|uniref:Mitochondrial glyco protein n=1 Tax=Obba rivulosa TaxID=1052685 RepID=A0A8E2AWD5_9APHY|nr:mitochondrial glyco protein [Obba rivulosa]